ncbi:hypothetical protein GCM10023192_58470 [Amycolatopsis samaneae]
MPVGRDARRWTSITPARTVLLVAHNVTTLTRLLDIIPAFENDTRVQLVFTLTTGDPFQHGITTALENTGIIVIPWRQAKTTTFDLVITASHHGKLGKLSHPQAILSHGIGYTKYSPRSQEPGARSQEPGARSQEPGARSHFGIGPEWTLRNGKPVAAALVLSHPSQLRQLADAAPAALPSATIGGDPCYDRLLASVPFRERYRSALGTRDRRLVLLSSTWSDTGLLGTRPALLRELAAELPRDAWQLAIAPHPNTWHGHGPGQLTRWHADCQRAGVLFLPEFDGWRAGLLAADVIVGDHGSVTGYAAALGRPTVLGAFDDVPPGTPITMLGSAAPRLPARGPYAPHLAAAIDAHRPDHFTAVRDLVSALPGRSLATLRALFYRLLRLDEPAAEVAVEVVPPYRPDPAGTPPFADLVEGSVEGTLVRLIRRPAEVQRAGLDDQETHLSCSADYPVRSLVDNAAIITALAADAGHNVRGWHETILARHPACVLTAVLREKSSQVLVREGPAITLTAPGAPPEALASILYAWRAEGLSWSALPSALSVELGGTTHRVAIEVS